ncbi:hypothetical protein GCM10007972_19030 [Iodidimonas muriae]|uniref:Transposase n=1 Tax=Iodidimonas muriae TaxID=261467 RepID=A0ABQ2LEA7_9PROT|nr:hypothetical protein JCM17843_13760 [Kordiimonadales bacterium JCM 17843]GGO13141.1 hypothetical protein GCM10007972_19030 [Iodidimonas muriae]
MFTAHYRRKTIKAIRKLPVNVADPLRTTFKEIADNHCHWNVKKLAGRGCGDANYHLPSINPKG